MGFAIVDDDDRLAVIYVPDGDSDKFNFDAGYQWDRNWVLSYHWTFDDALKAMRRYQAGVLT